MATIAFRAEQPLPMEHNPRKIFYRLFGQGDYAARAHGDPRRRRAACSTCVQAESTRFQAKLGAPDRERVDDYLESVREIERRVQNMSDQDLSALDMPDAPLGVPDDLRDAHEADVRPHGARVSGGSHARRYVHDGNGDQHA